MATELIFFGSLSKMYGSLTSDLRKEIASDMDVHQSVLRSWLHTLSYVRNISAHHARFWNREMAIMPRMPNAKNRWPYLGVDPKRSYAVLVVICDILERIQHPAERIQHPAERIQHPAERIQHPAERRNAFRAHLSKANSMQLAGMWAPKNRAGLRPWI
jgi:abortive infection bacteriophage resistance protein